MSGTFTELQKQKLMHMFELLDIDGNGVLEYEDFRLVVDTLAQERGWEEGHRRYTSLVASNKRLWGMVSRSIDVDGDGSITLMEWLAFHIKAILGEPDPRFSTALTAISSFFCEMLDSDGDGKVCLDDYIDFCAAYNVSEEMARRSFKLFDRDGSGDISQAEVQQMVQEFYLSDDPSAPGNLFFGAL